MWICDLSFFIVILREEAWGVFIYVYIQIARGNIAKNLFYRCCLGQHAELVEVGMPVGWAKNWAGARGCCSSCAFGMGEERLEPLTKALLVKGRCRCCVGFSSSKAGLLAI